MANTITIMRTNYFEVEDEARYAKLFSRLDAIEGELHDFSSVRGDKFVHGFGAYSDLMFDISDHDVPDVEPDYDGTFLDFLEDAKETLAPGSPIVAYFISYEKLRFVDGVVFIAAKGTAIRSQSLSQMAHRMLKSDFGLLGDIDDTY